MILIQNWDRFILEKYGNNKLAENLANRILSIFNSNFGRLILNKSLNISSSIGIIDNIDFINDTINVKLSNSSYGNMNPNGIILDYDKISNLSLTIHISLSDSEIIYRKIDNHNSIIQTINHEALHIIELFQTFSNEKSFSKSWKKGEILQQLKNKYNDSIFWYNDIYYFIYLSLPHEMRARLHQLNSELSQMNVKGVLNASKYIKNTKLYKDVEFLSKLDSKPLLSKLKTDKNYSIILKDFSTLFLEENNLNYEKNFIDYIKNISRRNKKLLDKLMRTAYNFEHVSFDERNKLM